ncbi:hypothetical protein Pcinc_034333 [Petrolisthes cinctipes]|uniref:ILEI/PANDER domain-containing protein n=1 Tax=Petrolisthes cinctipes TaxID=88211 RepID=A0AAE1EQI0_PETCI|nr:hypothetical protein Pcinc_034333 [Petrolisthes cinctipes]
MSGLSFCRLNLSDCQGKKLPLLLLLTVMIMMAILLHVPTASSAAINTTNTNNTAGVQTLLLRLKDTGNKTSAPGIVLEAAEATTTAVTTMTTTSSSLNVAATVTMVPERKTVTITAAAEEETSSNIEEKVTTSLKEAIASAVEGMAASLKEIITTTTRTTSTPSSPTEATTVPTESSVKATVPTSPQEATVAVLPRKLTAVPASDAVSMNGGDTSKGEISKENGITRRTPSTADGDTVKASSNVGDIWKEHALHDHSNYISSSDDEGIVGGDGAMKLKSMALQIEPEEKYKKDDLELELNAQNAHLLPTVKAIRSRRKKVEPSPERTQKAEPEQTAELETEPEQEIVTRDKIHPITKLEQIIQHQHQRESSDQETEKTQETRHKHKQEPDTQEPSADDSKASPGEVERAASSSSSISHLLLDVSINITGATVLVNGIQVYKCVNKTVQWGSKARRYHAGLHLVVLHQYTGRLMAADSFTTWQMTSDTAFLSALHNIQDGRLILILGAPDFTTFLGKEAMEELEWFGANYISNVAYKDVWCLVLYKGGGVVAEAVTTYFVEVEVEPRSFDLDSSPLTLQLAVLPTQEPQCSWYSLPHLTQRATFCRSYEGYGNFCRCDQLPWSPRPLRHSPQKDEVIPVAIVTGGRLPQVLRQVDQIRGSPGGDTTPIMIFVDGASPEADALGNLLQVTVTHHFSQIPIGESSNNNDILCQILNTTEATPRPFSL